MPMQNIEAIEAATETLREQGIHVLNSFLLGDDEPAHARRLLQLMDPPRGAVVLDAGCGTGALAALMGEERPDLTWKLLNVSEGQLYRAPVVIAGTPTQKLHASFDAIPLPEASVDVVMFAFSLCHSQDWDVTLREAARVLKPEGILFVFDMIRAQDGSNALMQELLQAHAYRAQQVMDAVGRAGFMVQPEHALGHVPSVYRLREVFEAKPVYDTLFQGIVPFTIRFRRRVVADPIESAFERHSRIAFQFSGGRDSTAALFSLRKYWKQLQVYFLDTGDHFPETLRVVDEVEQLLGKPIVRIASDVRAAREQFGYPSDLVPVDNTPLGRMVSGRPVKIVGRFDCCAANLMHPMHQRMRADGITLIVRGQRDADYAAPPARSGTVQGGVEVLYPIQDWSTQQVDEFLAREQLPVADFYDAGMPHGSDCMGCTAWWGEKRAAYLKARHPQAYEAYRGRVIEIRAEILRQADQLEI